MATVPPVPLYPQRQRPLLTRPRWSPWSRSLAVVLVGLLLVVTGAAVVMLQVVPLLRFVLGFGLAAATAGLLGLLLALIIDWEMPL